MIEEYVKKYMNVDACKAMGKKAFMKAHTGKLRVDISDCWAYIIKHGKTKGTDKEGSKA